MRTELGMSSAEETPCGNEEGDGALTSVMYSNPP